MPTTINITRRIIPGEVADPMLAVNRLIVDTAVRLAAKDALADAAAIMLPAQIRYNDTDYFPFEMTVTLESTADEDL